MITMQQLEELESRVIKALQLIGDLRAENGRLEADNDSLKAIAEEAKLALEEKEQEIARIQKELEAATNELAGIKEKEEVLEKKIILLLGKLDVMKSGESSPAARPSAAREVPMPEERPAAPSTRPAKAAASVSSPAAEEVSVETVKSEGGVAETGNAVGPQKPSDRAAEMAETGDDDIIIISDEAGAEEGVAVKSEAGGETEDDIILLDEGADEIIIEDVDSDLVIIDETETRQSKGKKESSGIIESDDDFLGIEEDKK